VIKTDLMMGRGFWLDWPFEEGKGDCEWCYPEPFFHLDGTLRLFVEFEAKLGTQGAGLSWRH